MLAGIEDSEREDEVFIPHSRVIVIVALLCFTVGAQQAAFSQEGQSPDDLFKNLSASVFRVEGLDWDEGWELLGSAVAVRPNVLVTNWHIIEAGRQAGFSLLRVGQGERTWPVELVVFDPTAGGTIRSDLCLLQIALKHGGEPKARPVRIRPSSALKVGEPVYAIGAPVGLELTMSNGIISGLRIFNPYMPAFSDNSPIPRIIQTTAAASHGSSGGGLFDANGRLVGIMTSSIERGQNLNFALPGELISRLVHAYERGNRGR
jgi:S1-C subfamily serine protease